MELISIVHELRLAKGTNKKIEILRQHKDNEMWKRFLKYTYDPFVSYGVSAPHDFTFDPFDITRDLFDKYDMLISRHLTGKAAKDEALRMSVKFGEIARLILNRSIKAGVSITTVNKVYPGLIVVWESMKGKDVPIQEFPIMASIKYDGVKVFVRIEEDTVTLYTSSGLPFSFESLASEFSSATQGMYEGELIHKEGKMIHRPVITGHLNSLLAGTKKEIPEYSYMIYDWIALEEWDSEYFKMSWEARQDVLHSQFDLGFKDSAYVRIVENHEQTNIDQQVAMFEYLTSIGYEGTMSRYAADTYTMKRVDRLIKKKSIQECVLTCIGTKPHSNPAKGIVGSLLLEGEVYDKKSKTTYFVTASTGSGLSKFDINLEPERYIGKSIEMMYNSVTTTEAGHSLFLPRFKRIQRS